MGFEWHKRFMIQIVSVPGFMNGGRRCSMPTQLSGHWWHFWHFSFLVSTVSIRYLIVFSFSFSCRLPEAVVDGVHHQDRAQVPGCGRDSQDGG